MGRPKGTRGLTAPLYRCRKTKHLARGTEPIDLTVEEYVIRRLSRSDAVGLLVDETSPRTEELRAKAVALRSRIRSLTGEFADDDDADAAEFRAATRSIKAGLADVEAQMAHLQRARVLLDIVTAEDPAKAWKDLMLDRQRAVVATLATVTLVPGRPSRAQFDPRFGTVRGCRRTGGWRRGRRGGRHPPGLPHGGPCSTGRGRGQAEPLFSRSCFSCAMSELLDLGAVFVVADDVRLASSHNGL
ncbi:MULTISPECIES: hypothetical protein [Streptomyces]|uniref:Recombinase zinc beta ribbon domain-containing protein n=2 Tax=Streptomyces TaxID=1883 RepID=A0ABV9J4Q6_9ACTN